MGAWSVLPFGNDDAADWAYALEEAEGLQPLEEAFDAVLQLGTSYLEAPEAAGAVAAAELVACLLGRPGDTETYTEAADAWLRQGPPTPGDALRQKALIALDRVSGADSELEELWRESEEHGAWLAAMAELRERVA